MNAHAMFRSAILSLLLGIAVLPARGQEPAPAEIRGEAILPSGGGVELTLPWRSREGDDVAWAAPGCDDRAWATTRPAARGERVEPEELRRIIWFRRHLRVERTLWGTPLGLDVASPARVDVYVDGVAIGSFGALQAAAQGSTALRRGPAFVTFSAGADHVLAVRYDGTARTADDGRPSPRFFLLSLAGPETALAGWTSAVRLGRAVWVALATIPLFLALLHLALYWFYRRARENLFYACSMAAFALIIFGSRSMADLMPARAAAELARLSPAAVFAAMLFGLLTYYAVRTSSLPRTWVPFSLVALVGAATSYVFVGAFWGWGWYVYFAVMIVEIVRVERSGRTVDREGARMLLWGLLLLAAFATLQALINVGAVAPLLGFRDVYVLGMLAFAVSMSLFLARTIARTSIHLERRLKEVQALSSQVLEQERAAHRQDLRQRLLVAENERKSRELEEARALQLSMLPAALPRIEGLEVAVAMTTATEVGGDYYDFRTDESGNLVLAVGDATGHGAAAGTMVAAVKALFSSQGDEGGLQVAMREYDRVLRSLNLKRMHMCLTVARIAPRSVAVCAAGMPPVLIRRACSGEVEELGEGSLPLGGNLSPCYAERVADLVAGDTLLFATDGLTELVDPAGRTFGYERTAAVLREADGQPAGAVVERLSRATAAWRSESEQADDITLVVVRVLS